jgi:hypothetical protein
VGPTHSVRPDQAEEETWCAAVGRPSESFQTVEK